MKKIDQFAAFILTHGRPNKIRTYTALRKGGYTGKIFLVIDDLDESREEYEKQYPGEVVVFNKEEVSTGFDMADNFSGNMTVVYARNHNWDLAEKLGIKYFIQLDDDYTDFRYKFNGKLHYGDWLIKDLDSVFEALLNFYEKIPALAITMAQGGDFIGGKLGTYSQTVGTRRKAMNTFICSTERRFKFVGRHNHDVSTYTLLGSRGNLFLQLNQLAINQLATQSLDGGLTEVYKEKGTYIKSFYTILHNPSSVKIATIGTSYMRIHHKVDWKHTVPEILSETFKKK
jgi:hypothetical protein